MRVDNWRMKRISAVMLMSMLMVLIIRTLGENINEKYSKGNTYEYAGEDTNISMKTPTK